MSVEDRLRQAVAPDEDGARERALLRLQDEFARREPVAPRRTRAPWAVAAVLCVLAAALSPPGEAVADWVRTAVGLRPELPTDRAPRADRLPSGGRLLVSSSGITWIVDANGKRRRLGAWSAASWSPHGKFVIAWKGRRLAALDLRGNVRWSLHRAAPDLAGAVVAERLPRRLPLRRRPARRRGRRHR